MNKFKHTALTLVATGLLSVQAHASEAHLQAIQPVAAFTQTDINTMFEQADKPMQLAALSAQEMRETEGAFLNFNFVIASGGGISDWRSHVLFGFAKQQSHQSYQSYQGY